LVDNNYRAARGGDPLAWDSSRQTASDPLAELARLIGQSDSYAETDRHQDRLRDHDAGRSREAAPAPGVDWATEESYDERDRRGEERYAPPAPAPYGTGGGRFLSGPAVTFNDFREGTDAYDRDAPSAQPPARQLPAYALAESRADDYESGQPEYQREETDAADDYYDEASRPRRRSGLVVVMTMLALVVVGTAGALGYRAMFRGSVLPTLPPIIKAGNGPNKIVPDSQANSGTQAGATTTGSAENLVSREEQPVNIEPPKAAPRVVATIPIITGQGTLPPGIVAPATEAPAQNSPLPPPSLPTPAPATVAAPTPPPTPSSPQAAAEPKKIHTVIIKADQPPGSADAPGVPSAQLSARAAARAASRPSSSPPPSGTNAPLPIVPGEPAAASAPPPQGTRLAAAPVAVASAGPVTGVQAAAAMPSGGGYAVQVTSQRNEAEAKASFQEIRAKFPNQLGGRQPIIRRADLGAKGTYYRALVGPFASAEQAAALCSGLKAAGGSCIVQKN
jgi:hypothetical protein